MIVINFKNYRIGEYALALAKKIEKYCPKAICAVPIAELEEISKNTKLALYAQHVDYIEGERATGFILPEEIKSEGAQGSIINHSEHRIGLNEIKKTIERLRKMKMKSIVCASDLDSAWLIKPFCPDMIAFEDPELIASGKSVTNYNSQGIKDFVELLKDCKIIGLCGAGVSTKEDIAEAIRLGCKGVLISSAIAKAKNPEKLLKEIREYC